MPATVVSCFIRYSLFVIRYTYNNYAALLVNRPVVHRSCLAPEVWHPLSAILASIGKSQCHRMC